MKQRVYFLRCGTTTDMSLISRRTGVEGENAGPALLDVEDDVVVVLEAECPFAAPAPRLGMASSCRRLFFEAGSDDDDDDSGERLQMCSEIWLKSSMYAGVTMALLVLHLDIPYKKKIRIDVINCRSSPRE